MNWIAQNPIKAICLLLAIAVVIVWIIFQYRDAPYEVLVFRSMTYEAFVDLLTPIFIIALFVERALEVFVATGRKIEQTEKEKAVQQSEAKIAQLNARMAAFQSQLDAPGAARLSPSEISAIQARRENIANLMPDAQRRERHARVAFEKHRSETRRITFVVGAAFGLVIALGGIRGVAPLIDLQAVSVWSGLQEVVFHSVDVILTAGLLAGGASGIHQIISTFGAYTTQTRRKAETG